MENKTRLPLSSIFALLKEKKNKFLKLGLTNIHNQALSEQAKI